ncbi:hypothetical protein ACEPPN_013327 [Leptodophora sp. 'Broadleaf-Isolate-01']
MGLIKAGIFLYGAHLVAKNIYGDKKETSTEGGWCQRSQAPQSEVPQGPQGLQGPPPTYAPSNTTQGPPQQYQQWQEKAAIEPESAPKQCTCGAAQSNQANANFTKH